MHDRMQPGTVWRGAHGGFATCLSFLTRLPIRTALVPLSQAMWAFPLVGAAIGLATAIVLAALARAGLPALAAAALAFAVSLLLTGALHEDGLADTADGFGGGATRERKLAIMRDSRIGTYGVLALVVLAFVKVSALAAISALPWPGILALLTAAGAASRAWMVWLLHAAPPARNDGLSHGAGRPAGRVVAWALGLGLGLSAVLGWAAAGLALSLAVLFLSGIAAAAIRWIALRQIGGQSGDVCGAVQAVSEALMLAGFAASLH